MLKNISVWALLTISAVIAPEPPSSPQITENPPAATIQQVEKSTASYTQPPVAAPATAKVPFERVRITSTPAPKPEPKVVKKAAPTPETPEKDKSSESDTTTATQKAANATQTTPSKNTTPAHAATPTAPPVAVTPGSVKAEAANQMKAYSWGADQLACLVSLWEKESNWNFTAENPSSGAYGIPQSLPGNKMATAGADWRTNPATQIKWGLGYIAERYKTPCKAWGHSVAVGWY